MNAQTHASDAIVWRAEDEALLQRLADERALKALFRFHMGRTVAALPHPRAAGMVAGARAIAKLAEPIDPRALARALEPATLDGFSPELCHHEALYFGRIADAVSHDSPDGAVRARVRSLAAWLALTKTPDYLAGLAADILGEPLDDATRATVSRFPFDAIDALGDRADAGARDRTRESGAALRALSYVHDACKIAAISREISTRATAIADARKLRAIDLALEPIGAALAEADARNVAPLDRAAIIARAADVWHWSGRDAAAEEFAIDRVTPIAWELYRARKWDELRLALAPVAALVDALAARVETSPEAIAYAAGCAEVLMFRSEIETTIDRQIQAGERTLRVCPTHRNGRLVMATYLCDKAERTLRATILRASDAHAAEEMITRAERLYPTSKSLPEAKNALARAKSRWPGAFGAQP